MPCSMYILNVVHALAAAKLANGALGQVSRVAEFGMESALSSLSKFIE